MNITTLGIDLAKNVFQVCGADERGKVVLMKRLSRKKLLPFVANLPACLIGLEASAGAHYWARSMIKLGHEVRLISPQFVKPYVKGNKNDFNDASGICEAVTRPTMRFVPVKDVEQQDIQAVHRVRQQLVKSRTALSNQIRGLLSEYGIVMGKGLAVIRRQVPLIIEDGENGLSDLFRQVLSELYQRLRTLDGQIAAYDKKIKRVFAANDACQRLESVEGVGPMTATAFLAAVGDGRAFSKGRQVSAWLGLVPRQHSSGEKTMLLGISKRGDRYLRTLLIHGARAVVQKAKKKTDRRSQWIRDLCARRNENIAVVALANKNARILWALLHHNDHYRQVA